MFVCACGKCVQISLTFNFMTLNVLYTLQLFHVALVKRRMEITFSYNNSGMRFKVAEANVVHASEEKKEHSI